MKSFIYQTVIIAAGLCLSSTALAQAQAPDSRFQQLTLAGGYSLPELRTVMSLSASMGRITQDEELLPYTTNANLPTDPLPRSSLDAEVDTTNIAAAITSRVFRNGRIEFRYRYDERDNKTARDTWNRVIVDTFPSGGEELNVPYSFERSYLSLSGDYELFDMLLVSAGYEEMLRIIREDEPPKPSTRVTDLGDRATATAAYRSMKDIEFAVTFGMFLRNAHRWAAHGMVAVVFLHMCRVFFTGSYEDNIILDGYRASYVTVHNNGDYGIYAFNAENGTDVPLPGAK